MTTIAHKPDEIGNIIINAEALIKFLREVKRQIEANDLENAKRSLDVAVNSFAKYKQ